MRKMPNLLQKISFSLLIILSVKSNLKAQEDEVKKERKIYTSTDLTIYGLQGRLAYDLYTTRGNCFGVSVSQIKGIKRENEDNTMFYNLEEIRLNLSVRYTRDIYTYNRLHLFGIFQAGISYNTILTGEQLILPSLRIGGGTDITIYKSSGIRLEAGVGSPYFVSLGYFFKI